MKQRIITFVLALVLLASSLIPVSAFSGDEHDACLEKVLFDNGVIPSGGAENLKLLEYASYLCVDQFNGEGTTKLNYLSSAGVSNLPKNIEVIDYTASGNTHRRYTHQGWNYLYTGEKDQANWPIRKTLLCSTANKVFDFGIANEAGNKYCQKCDSFCAMVYYIHLLGDCIADKKYIGASEHLPFARAHASENNMDLIYDLHTHLSILFDDQSSSYKYVGMMSKLNGIAKKARALSDTTGGINTDEKFQEYKGYEEEYLEVLQCYIPKLLRKELFFKSAFSV